MAQLPIQRVVLYKHGVGYFEREGTVTGDTAVSLTFKQREVSDVLKSLTVLDLNGGVISAVSYDSTTPVEQLLAEIALSIPDESSLIGLLPQLKGARVRVKPTGTNETIEGTLLGIDTVTSRTEGGVMVQTRVSIFTDTAEMRTFDLFDLDLQLLDDGIKRDLEFYLKTQLGSKKKDARTFTLFAKGEGERTLSVGYVLEAPVWKATYRILLNDSEDAGEAAKEPRIQGWAVVDNTSDEDWTDIALSLVAGLPVSFTHDLYTPRYIRRPVVEVKESTGVLPPMAEAALMLDYAEPEMILASAPPPMMARSMSVSNSLEESPKRKLSRVRGESAASSVSTQTRERQVGDLFEYAIDQPVTVRRNQSALVPIVLKSFAGRSVLLYQKHARPENPIRCVEFENTTGLTLEGGPVTVLEGGSYVGEAMLDTMKPTEQRLVGYAVELAVRVSTSIDSHEDAVSRVIVRNATLWTHYSQVQQTTYTFTSKAQKEQILYVDQPRPGANWLLNEPKTAHETTENFWRFRMTVPANKTAQFVVKSHSPSSSSFLLTNLNEPQLQVWIAQKYIDSKTEQLLRKSFTIREKMSEADQTKNALVQERETIRQEQARIRENLQALGDRSSEKELRERYIRTLNQQEDRLEQIEAALKQTQSTRDIANRELHALLHGIEFEGEPK